MLFAHVGHLYAGCRASDNAQASGNIAGLAGAAPGSCVLEVSNVTNIALAFGFSIFVLVYATAAYTGEPTLALLLFARRPLYRNVRYLHLLHSFWT